VIGVFAILTSLVWIGVESAINFMMELISIAAAGVLGIFVSGVFSRKVSQRGVLAGIVACVLFTAWATFTSVRLPAFGRTLLDLGAFNYGWNNKLIGVLGNVVMIAVSVVASYVFGGEQRDVNHLTVWAKRANAAH
jgi:SSS family solute:Na+ symporter